MHIEPGVVNEAKMALSYATAAGATGLTIKYAAQTLRQSKSAAFVLRFMIATLLTVFFFEVLPKFPVGVSEVHFIFGSTLFLLFGAAPAAIGLAAGLAIQSLILSPADLAAIFYEHNHTVVSVICDFMGCRADYNTKYSLRGLHLHAGAETVSDLSSRHCGLGSVLGFLWPGFWGGQH